MLRRLIALLVALAGSLVIVFVTASAASADCTADPVTGEVVCDDEDGGNRVASHRRGWNRSYKVRRRASRMCV